MYDVIVAGAGPTGSRIAGQLAGGGHSVLVIERKPAPGGKLSCTGIIGKECVDAFGIDEKVILRSVNSARIFSPSGFCVRVHRDETQACIVDRDAFDKHLAERAAAAGVEFRFNCELVEHDGAPGGGIGAVCKEHGKTVIFEARAIVYACGYSHDLIASLGLGHHRDTTTGAQANVEIRDLEEVEVYFGEVSPKFFGWLVPSRSGQARVGLLARRNAAGLLKTWLERLAREHRIASSEVPVHYGGIPLKPLPRTYADRTIILGDAAGQVKPVTGGGIYYGLLCADIAAGHLHRALEKDDLSAANLAGYERDWHEKLLKELRTGYLGRRVYERLGFRTIARLFMTVEKQGIVKVLLDDPDLKFDWHGGALRRLVKYRPGLLFRVLLSLPFSLSR